jgi:hypothetical protein
VHHARAPARKGDHSGGPSDTARSAPARELRFPPRGMSRVEAADYVGISPSLFDTTVRDGRMPGPKLMGARLSPSAAVQDRSSPAVDVGEDQDE